MSRLLLAWAVCVLLGSQGWALSLNMLKQSTAAFSSSLLDLANTKLGVQYMQEYYNTLQYSQQQKNASDIARDLARDTSDLFTTQKVALKRLKDFIEGIYADQSFVTSGRLECCNAQNLTNNYEFIAPISKESSCDRVSAIADESAPSIYNRLNHIYRGNDQAPLKWQYFGSEFGVANQFPAVRAPDCGSYDPRFRPWYISTATPNPKDVVLVIKNSCFLQADGRKRLFEAATIILRTLNPRDRVAIVLYSQDVRKPAVSGCYTTNLSLATPANIRKFQNFLDAAPPPYAGNNVSLALRTAYQYFCSDKQGQGARRERAILLFTDGERIDNSEKRTEIMNRVEHYTTSLAFNITLFIFTASDSGASVIPEVRNFYKSLVSMDNIDTRHYIELPSSGDLRQNMADFYSSFAATAQQTDQYAPVINVPYQDVFGLDQLVITISTPCYANDVSPKLVGVAALDLTLSDLLAGVEYFREGELSYAFLIDSEGFVLFHPLLPSPSGNDSAVYLDISTLEPQPMFSSVREAMISGGSGCMVLNTTQVLSRGSNAYDGARTVVIPSNYCWAPVDGTPFSLCVVIPVISHLNELSGAPFQTPISAHYHRLDILTDNDQLCSHLSQRATKDYSTVVLCPEAFARPDMYILTEETRDSVLYTQEALTTLTDGRQIFRRGILQSVAATAKAEDVWLNDSTSDTQHIAWRYIATGNGVIRVYPGIQVATKQLNALQRPWYQRAVSHLGLLSVSPPYDSGLGYGRIMTLSQAILPSDCLGSESDRPYCGVLAVMGMDVTHAYFSLLLRSNIPLCSLSDEYMCLLIDSNAYLVTHPYFTAEPQTGELSYHHLAELEPLIARDMVGMGYLRRVYCNNFQYNADFTKRPRRQYSYEVTEQVISATEPLEGGYSTFCTFYQVAPVLGTNVFLIVVELVRSSHGRCAPIVCPCDPDQPCSSLPTDCTCPCSQDIPPCNYNPCLESFNGLNASACPTRFSLEDLESPIAGIPTNGTLPMCFEPTCDPRYNQIECLSILACEYCSCSENSLDECRVEGMCPTCTSTPDSTESCDDTDGITWQAIAGAILALAILLTCLLVTFACLYMRERIERKKGQLSSTDANPRLQLYAPTFEIGSLSITSKEVGSFLSSPTRSNSHLTSRQLSCPTDVDTSSGPTVQGPPPETEESNLQETDGSFSNIIGVSPNPSNAGGIWF